MNAEEVELLACKLGEESLHEIPRRSDKSTQSKPSLGKTGSFSPGFSLDNLGEEVWRQL